MCPTIPCPYYFVFNFALLLAFLVEFYFTVQKYDDCLWAWTFLLFHSILGLCHVPWSQVLRSFKNTSFYSAVCAWVCSRFSFLCNLLYLQCVFFNFKSASILLCPLYLYWEHHVRCVSENFVQLILSDIRKGIFLLLFFTCFWVLFSQDSNSKILSNIFWWHWWKYYIS